MTKKVQAVNSTIYQFLGFLPPDRVRFIAMAFVLIYLEDRED